MDFFFSRFIRTFSALLTILLLKYYGGDDILGSFTYWYILIFFAAVFIKFNHQVFILRFSNVIGEKFSSLFYFSFYLAGNGDHATTIDSNFSMHKYINTVMQ